MSKRKPSLNPHAVKKADADFKKNNPEAKPPYTKEQKKEWWSSYKQHDAQSKGNGNGAKQPAATIRNPTPVGSTSVNCPKKEPIKCALRSIEIGPCGHKGALIRGEPREYAFKILSEDDDKKGDGHRKKGNAGDEYHVLAGDTSNPDKVTVKVDVKLPLCDEHKPKLIEVSSDNTSKVIPSHTTELELYSKDIGGFDLLTSDPVQFFKNYFWLGEVPPREYKV
ncbi:MAG: hypothetical protein ACRDTR_22665, partial [Rubrobacter sp.]